MKNNTKEIDQLIKETLSTEEAAFYDALDEQNVFEMIFGLYKGKNAWFVITTNIVAMLFMGLFFYSTYLFFTSEPSLEILKWGLMSIISLTTIGLLKIYAWMQMDKKAILREMKRLELLVISGSGK